MSENFKILYTAKEAAALMSVSPATFNRMNIKHIELRTDKTTVRPIKRWHIQDLIKCETYHTTHSELERNLTGVSVPRRTRPASSSKAMQSFKEVRAQLKNAKQRK